MKTLIGRRFFHRSEKNSFVVLVNISVLINDVCMMDTSLEQAETEVRET